MTSTLKVSTKSNYGRTLVHPECNVSKAFASIAGTKTLTTETIEKLKSIGYTFELTNTVTI